MNKYNYGTAILSGFEYLLENYPETFVIGQGLWSPWYVGNTMTDLDKKFGVERIIDTPVSESACTGAAVGAALAGMKPKVLKEGKDITIAACGYGTYLAQEAENILASKQDVSAEIIDVRILNPFNPEVIIDSVRKTRNLLVVDPGTKTSSFSAEIVSSVVERVPQNTLESQPVRIALPDAPAPTSRVLESDYYFTDKDIVIAVKKILNLN